jgi:hypothetical protein
MDEIGKTGKFQNFQNFEIFCMDDIRDDVEILGGR